MRPLRGRGVRDTDRWGVLSFLRSSPREFWSRIYPVLPTVWSHVCLEAWGYWCIRVGAIRLYSRICPCRWQRPIIDPVLLSIWVYVRLYQISQEAHVVHRLKRRSSFIFMADVGGVWRQAAVPFWWLCCLRWRLSPRCGSRHDRRRLSIVHCSRCLVQGALWGHFGWLATRSSFVRHFMRVPVFAQAFVPSALTPQRDGGQGIYSLRS